MKRRTLKTTDSSACVYVPNPLNEMSFKDHTVTLLKFMAAYIWKLQVTKDSVYEDSSTVFLSVQDLEEKFHISNARTLRTRQGYLLDKLESLRYYGTYEDGKGYKSHPVFDTLGYHPGTHKFEMQFREELWNNIKNISQYTKWYMLVLATLKTLHSIKLYQLLYQYKNTSHKSRTFKVEELRKHTDTLDKPTYDEFRYFNNKVIKKMVNEINTSDTLPIYNVTYVCKPLKKTEEVTFFFEYDKEKEERLISGVIEHTSAKDRILKEKVLDYLQDNVPEIVRHEGGTSNLLHILMTHNEGITYRDILLMSAKELDDRSR